MYVRVHCSVNELSKFHLLISAPVSFSIKPKEISTPTVLKPVIALEHSSDEEQIQSNINKVVKNVYHSTYLLNMTIGAMYPDIAAKNILTHRHIQ